jgi:titin
VVPQKKQEAKKLKLSWTDNSSDELGFIIARSIDGTNFSLIDTMLPGITTYTDTGLQASTLYYFKVAAYNSVGNSAYTTTVSSTTLARINEIENAACLIYPNPSPGLFTITFSQSAQAIHIQVTDVLGKEVYSETLAKGVNFCSLNLIDLPNGVYLLHGMNGSVQKLIVEK